MSDAYSDASEITDREVETLRAMVLTLLGRVEALERTVSAIRDRETKIRRAVGQLGAAFDLTNNR